MGKRWPDNILVVQNNWQPILNESVTMVHSSVRRWELVLPRLHKSTIIKRNRKMFALFGSPFPKASRLELSMAIYSGRSKQLSIPMYLSNASVMLAFASAEAPL